MMRFAFPCGHCGRGVRHDVTEFGHVVACTCGAAFWAIAAQIDDDHGISVLMARDSNLPAFDSRCMQCGEPVGRRGFPPLALFRTVHCSPDHWHVVDLCGQMCPACQAPLPVETDDSLCPAWKAMAE